MYANMLLFIIFDNMSTLNLPTRKIFWLFCLLPFLGCKKDKLNETQTDQPNSKRPKVVTYPYQNLTRYSITITGAVTDSAASTIMISGFVVDTLKEATIARNLNNFVRSRDNSGQMLVIITNMPAGKTYYLRSYAQSKFGIAYGNEIVFSSSGENLYRGSIVLSSQQEVEDFGKKHINRIDGSLEIRGTVTDLSPLKNLGAINYAFNIQNTNALTSLKGMDSLEAVNAAYFFHGVRIENNIALKSLEGLEKITTNNGFLYIINNDALTNLNGLNNLSLNHFGEVRIEGCDKIQSLHGLEKLAWLDGDIMIKDNLVLTDVSALNTLSFIRGRFRAINNPSLAEMNGLEKLHAIEGVEIYDNNALTSLGGLRNLDTISDIILLRNNTKLKDLSPFHNVKTTQFLNLADLPSVTELTGFSQLNNVKGNINIDNTGLIDLHGLEGITKLQRLDILNNKKLQSLHGIDNLVSLENSYSLTIVSNQELTSLAGLGKLKSAAGMIVVVSNSKLQEFCGLKTLIAGGWKGYLDARLNLSNPDITAIVKNCP
jgi:hypothetical protein